VCYLDSTVALPLLTAYALARHEPRPLKRLYDQRNEMMATLRREYELAAEEPMPAAETETILPQHR
jgi:deoxyhypusine synthase